jgi:enhancing lycopene biosynthesis protein 2
MLRRAGVLLSGCGLYDGSEVGETVLLLLALDRAGARVEPMAPDAPQCDVVDHASATVVEGVSRNILTESCRLVRGRVTDLRHARPEVLDALFLPGGYGAAKNLLTGFAQPGRRRELAPGVAELLSHFLSERKPIGVVSLAETLLAAALGEPLREDPFSLPATELRIDEERNIVFTSGFLGSERVSEVATGIEKMVAEVLDRSGRTRPSKATPGKDS